MNESRRPAHGYHHGDLANALAEAATELAREGGPEAVVLREAARRVGVSPTAAYRHFRDRAALIDTVKVRVLAALAAAIQARLDRCGPGGDPVPAALDRLRAAAHGYLDFVLAEPGLFRLVFDRPDVLRPGTGGPPSDDPAYGLLVGVVEELVAAGRIAPADRPHTETAAWAAVHGLAMLLSGGPLAQLPAAERDRAIDRTLEVVARGL